MDDLHYDAMQKKSIARGARARKCGSKSKHCSLPSDRLTNKQWKERCGKVMEYNLSKPMTWKELRDMPEDIQVEYLKGLSMKYAVSLSKLSDMLGVHPVTVRKHLQSTGAYKYYDRGRGYKMPEGSARAFDNFLNPQEIGGEACKKMIEALDKEEETSAEACDVCSVAPAEVVLEKLHHDIMPVQKPKIRTGSKLSSFRFTMSGPADIMSISNSLRLFVKDGENVEITVNGSFV